MEPSTSTTQLTSAQVLKNLVAVKRRHSQISSEVTLLHARIAELEDEDIDVQITKKVLQNTYKRSDKTVQLNIASFFTKPKLSPLNAPAVSNSNEESKESNMMISVVKGPPVQEKFVIISWSKAVKEKALTLLKTLSPDQVFRHFKNRIPLSTIYRWKNVGTKILDKKKSGRKPADERLESELLEWFLIARARKLEIDGEILKKKGLKICAEYKIPVKCSNGWLSGWKKRHQISKRKVTTLTSKKVEEVKPLIEEFYGTYDQMMMDSGEYPSDQPEVWNYDECPVFFELHKNETLEVKNFKDASGKFYKNKVISGFGTSKAKMRATVVLFVSSRGRKLPPIIILKGKAEEPKRLQKAAQDLAKESNVPLLQNSKGWVNAKIMKNIFIHFSQYMDDNKESLLLGDNFSAHKDEEALDLAAELGVKPFFLPPQTTPILQPIDVSVNRSFKAHVRSQFKAWAADKVDQYIKDKKKKHKIDGPDRSLVIQWIINGWKNITKETIINGNKVSHTIII